jgi:hypothetical protein
MVTSSLDAGVVVGIVVGAGVLSQLIGHRAEKSAHS